MTFVHFSTKYEMFINFIRIRSSYTQLDQNIKCPLQQLTIHWLCKLFMKILPSRLTLTASLKSCLRKQMMFMMFVPIPKVQINGHNTPKASHVKISSASSLIPDISDWIWLKTSVNKESRKSVFVGGSELTYAMLVKDNACL